MAEGRPPYDDDEREDLGLDREQDWRKRRGATGTEAEAEAAAERFSSTFV